jgi:hypothetical protein
MQVVEVQGLKAVGMSELDFFEHLQALPPAGALALKVRPITHSGSIDLVVPFSPVKPASSKEPLKLVPARERIPLEEAKARLAAAVRAIDRDNKALSKIDWKDEKDRQRLAAAFETSHYLECQLATELERLLPHHLQLFCETAADDDFSVQHRRFCGVLIGAIDSHDNYAPDQKTVALRYLPDLPGLINIVDRMNWAEGADAILRKSWSTLNSNENFNIPLDPWGSTYSCLAARHGTVEALVTIARNVLEVQKAKLTRKDSATRPPSPALVRQYATLTAVVPFQSEDVHALAEFVIKNRRRLEFDAAKGVYVLKP